MLWYSSTTIMHTMLLLLKKKVKDRMPSNKTHNNNCNDRVTSGSYYINNT